jgi:hypothetical protein
MYRTCKGVSTRAVHRGKQSFALLYRKDVATGTVQRVIANGAAYRGVYIYHSHEDSTERGVFTGEIRTYRVWSLDVGRYIEVNICHLSILLEG